MLSLHFMASQTHSLVLSEPQQEVLLELGINLANVFIITGDVLHEAVRIDGYTNGHYVFFLTGSSVEHANFLRYLYGSDYKLTLPARFRGLTVYGSPTERFVKSENTVNITTAANTLINYGD